MGRFVRGDGNLLVCWAAIGRQFQVVRPGKVGVIFCYNEQLSSDELAIVHANVSP